MAKLVAVYTMYVYNNGNVDLKEVELDSNSVSTEGASSSIRQIVKVLEHVANSNSQSGIRRKVNEGINAVAKSEGINVSSVHAKVLRKLNLSMKEFKDLVEKHFESEDEQLPRVLRSACVARTKAADNAAIEQLLKMIEEKKKD